MGKSDSDKDNRSKICDGCGEEEKWCKCMNKHYDSPKEGGGHGFFGGGGYK